MLKLYFSYCTTLVGINFFLFLFLVSYCVSGANVTIVTDPPGPVYPAGTWIRFKCILNKLNQEPVLHEW